MKKKFISIVVFLFSVFFMARTEVLAASNPYTIFSHDVPTDTYIIGSHAFDTNRTYLSTEDIMWAARTIEDVESKDDMIIYYKNYDGEWINGRTGENVTVPSTFKIEEVNGEEVKGIFINTVLEEWTNEESTGFSSIHEDDYNQSGLWLKKDETKTEYNYDVVFDAFNINDGDYKFDIKCHDYEITEDDYIPTPFNIGTTPSSITVTNGGFRLPIEFNSEDINDYVSCAITLETEDESIESGFSIAFEDAMPTLNAFGMHMTANSTIDEGIGFYTIFSDVYNQFYDIYNSSFEVTDFSIGFFSRFIEEGDYNLEVNATRDGETININYPDTLSIGEGEEPVFIYSNAILELSLKEKLSVGEYEFEITLRDIDGEEVTTEYVYLLVSDEAKMDISKEVWEEPEVYYSLDELAFDNSKKRKFNMDIFTENIPVGTYAVKAKLDYMWEMVIPVNFELKYNQNVDIIKPGDVEYFDFAFEVPKGADIGYYYVELTLHEYVEDSFGDIVVSEAPIASTGFTFAVTPRTPVINYESKSGDELSATYDMVIDVIDLEDRIDNGWELYIDKEIDSAEYVEIDGVKYYLYSDKKLNEISQIDIETDETIKFVARNYITNSSSKLYSDWSDVIEITYDPSE